MEQGKAGKVVLSWYDGRKGCRRREGALRARQAASRPAGSASTVAVNTTRSPALPPPTRLPALSVSMVQRQGQRAESPAQADRAVRVILDGLVAEHAAAIAGTDGEIVRHDQLPPTPA
jgi:hypothetical protein